MKSYSQRLKERCSVPPKKNCCKNSFDHGYGICSQKAGENDIAPDLSIFRCKNCKESFLKGVFCACGTLSSPEKGYFLELRIAGKETADAIFDFLSENSVVANRRIFRGKYCLYLRKCEDIQSFLFLLGEQKEAFRLADGRISSDFSNNANRARNCDTRNIRKAVEAAGKEIDAIKKLFESGEINLLDPPLRETAELRLKNEEMTIAELAGQHKEKISKSGVYHRLIKITEAAEKIK